MNSQYLPLLDDVASVVYFLNERIDFYEKAAETIRGQMDDIRVYDPTGNALAYAHSRLGRENAIINELILVKARLQSKFSDAEVQSRKAMVGFDEILKEFENMKGE